MEVADLRDVARDVGDEVALGDLLVVDVEEQADARAAHLVDHAEALLGRGQVVALVVDEHVQGLDGQGDARLLAEGAAARKASTQFSCCRARGISFSSLPTAAMIWRQPSFFAAAKRVFQRRG